MFNKWYFPRGLQERQHCFSPHKRNQIFLKELQSNKATSIISKTFERLIFNISCLQYQLGFIPGDSYASQLLSITQDIHKSFDCNIPQDVRRIFLDISKAFNKVWNEETFRLKTCRLEGKLIILLENYFKTENKGQFQMVLVVIGKK